MSELNIYMKQISKYKILSKAEEYKIAKKYKETGNIKYRDQLITANLRFVVKIAHTFRGYGFEIIDLIQEGNLGLFNAAKKFDPERNLKFISYAVWWIKAKINSYVLKNWSLVKTGTTEMQRKLFFEIRRIKNSHATDEEARAEIAARYDMDIADVSAMENRLIGKDLSLDAKVCDAEHADTYVSTLEYSGPLPDQFVIAVNTNNILARIANDEANRSVEQDIIDRRLLAEDPATLGEIAKDHKMCRERIRQIQQALLARMKDYEEIAELAA
jgi:RNA polymerase sigma-32 factor